MRVDWIFLFLTFILSIYVMFSHYLSVQRYLNEIKIDTESLIEISENIDSINLSQRNIVIIVEYSNLTIRRYQAIYDWERPKLYISKILENNTLFYVEIDWRRGRDSNPRPPGHWTLTRV